MSTEIANLDARLAAEADEAVKVEGGGVDRAIRVQNGMLWFQGKMIPDGVLDVVVLSARTERAYYETAWDPDKPSLPTCRSKNGTTPDEDVENPPGDKCESCPMNQWGSGSERRKACKETRRLIVVPADNPSGEFAFLRLPVTAIKSWVKYVGDLQSQFRRPPYAVFTQIRAIPDRKTQIKFDFVAKGLIPNEVLSGLIETVDNLK